MPFEFVFKCVDIVSGFHVRSKTVPYFWPLVRRQTLFACVILTKLTFSLNLDLCVI